MSKVWYVTGGSKGLGLTLVKFLLENGHKVAATSRKKVRLEQAAGNVGGERFLPLEVDLADEGSIASSLADAHRHFGKLDVVVNNAGYGIGGAIEELSTQEIADSMNINLMATIQVVRHAMPYLREQRSGHIINISSIAGTAGTMGWSVYAAAKSAVIALTEGLALDVKELGIRAMVIAPGAFRTDFLSAGSLVIAAKEIADYAGIHANHARYLTMDGQQAGDALKAAKLMVDLVEDPAAPVVLYIGSDAYARATKKVEEQRAGLEKYKALSASTDF